MIDVRLYAHLAPAAGRTPQWTTGNAAQATAAGNAAQATGTGEAPARAAAGAPGTAADGATPRVPESAEFQVEARPGLTVRDVVTEAGVRPEDVYIIILNGARADLDSLLADGDRLGLFPAVSGG